MGFLVFLAVLAVCALIGPPLGFAMFITIDWTLQQAVSLILTGEPGSSSLWSDFSAFRQIWSAVYLGGALQALIGGAALAAQFAWGATRGPGVALLSGAALGLTFTAWTAGDISDGGALVGPALTWTAVHLATALGCWLVVRALFGRRWPAYEAPTQRARD